jgi:2-C-methyl-D-erythritol 4-phosphate cytidylyltransferase
LDYSRLFFNKYFPKSNIFIVVNKKVIIKKLKTNEKKIYGSSSRLKSLHAALRKILQENIQTKYTLIHDIARPILNIADIKRLVASIKLGADASTLGYPLTNALKEVKKNIIDSNLFRDNLWSSFTPQIFKTDKLYESVEKIIEGGYDVDDDIEALMMSNFKCSIVKSSPDNIKITYLEDIEVIKKLL